MKKFPCIVAAVALSGSALAADEGRGAPGIDLDVDTNLSMPMADKNSDGKVTKAEAASNQKLAAEFDKFDKNKDGSLDKAEFAKFEGSAKGKTGDEKAQPGNVPGTTDDSVPGNKDKPGPGR